MAYTVKLNNGREYRLRPLSPDEIKTLLELFIRIQVCIKQNLLPGSNDLHLIVTLFTRAASIDVDSFLQTATAKDLIPMMDALARSSVPGILDRLASMSLRKTGRPNTFDA